ncbi:hypothetical protein F0562_034228 [Nyssa sinensis]|uniref:RRM domain-containing protein n=1 Tax=Nyssa sinensis TaxID=561372 RepID=A0A5J5AIG5_9ASTE|nr:hypothetical protein F0562_034228 [Nyssa sinensis]
MPFCEGGCVGYPQFVTPPVDVSQVITNPPLPPSTPTPSRMLLLSSVPTDVSESTVRRELEVFGDVRAVQMEKVRDGIVTVHFYDLRHAEEAMVEIREQHMQQQSRLRKHFDALLTQNSAYEVKNLVVPLPPPARGLIAGRAVWAQFMIPAMAGVPDGQNQGTLVIFNLDSEVQELDLMVLFSVKHEIDLEEEREREYVSFVGLNLMGLFPHISYAISPWPVKELRETPLKRHQRFVEFYDVRDAAKAIMEMNGKDIHGKHAVIAFSRPGGHSKRFLKSTHKTINSFHSTANYSTRNPRSSPPHPPPPPPLPRKISGYSTRESSTFSKGNPNENGGTKNKNNGVVQASIATLSTGNRIEETNNRSCKKFSKKNCNGNTTKQQPWKGRQRNNFDSHFLINDDAIMESNCRDSRTTVMIKNIPNKYRYMLCGPF